MCEGVLGQLGWNSHEKNMKAKWMLGALLALCLYGCSSTKPQQTFAEKALQIGDCLDIQFVIDNEAAKTTDKIIDLDGNIMLPEVGKVHVAGMKLSEAEPTIQRALFSPAIFHHVEISVSRCK